MLGCKDAGRERVGRIIGEHRHRRLGEDGARIHLCPNHMHGAAAELHACLDDALMGVEAFEGGEQRGVDVEMAVAPTLDEAFGVQPQEARIAEELDACLAERLIESGRTTRRATAWSRGTDAPSRRAARRPR